MNFKSHYNIIIGCTGSVATIKVPLLAEKFIKLGHKVKIVPTCNALHFLKTEAVANGKAITEVACCHTNNYEDKDFELEKYNKNNEDCKECLVKNLYPEFEFSTDKDEWTKWNRRGDPVMHIELREWADLLLIAPLDANTLAKMAQGICDNLLTCIVRAWNITKPVYFCPAMNTQMYIHPFTSQHINILKDLGYHEIKAISKMLICGEEGKGAMAEVDVIFEAVKGYLNLGLSV